MGDMADYFEAQDEERMYQPTPEQEAKSVAKTPSTKDDWLDEWFWRHFELDASSVMDNMKLASAKKELTTHIAQEVMRGKVEAVKELKHRWHEDRKIMDYSPATYDFICDKYLAELQQSINKEDAKCDCKAPKDGSKYHSPGCASGKTIYDEGD